MKMRAVLALAVAGLALTACSSGPAEYRVLITEPSNNITPGVGGQLFGYWSCDPAADTTTSSHGAQAALWKSVDGEKERDALQFTASCPAGSLLTVQVDAAVAEVSSHTQLRCEIYDASGVRVAEETVTRGTGADDPVCRVPVP